VLVGFAAETEPDPERLLALGREKIAAKGCDYLVLNEVGWTTGFGAGDTAVTVLDAAGDSVGSARGDKVSVALAILDLVARG
jgi:phosphopantothenoylcysteine decarboxylase/phosphopantothenate--cysteine ligase